MTRQKGAPPIEVLPYRFILSDRNAEDPRNGSKRTDVSRVDLTEFLRLVLSYNITRNLAFSEIPFQFTHHFQRIRLY